jgi:hypothetical protein
VKERIRSRRVRRKRQVRKQRSKPITHTKRLEPRIGKDLDDLLLLIRLLTLSIADESMHPGSGTGHGLLSSFQPDEHVAHRAT